MRFRNRYKAGDRLGEALAEMLLGDPMLLAVPRGGVPVASRVASTLDAPMSVVVAQKVGAPPLRGYGLGAIGEGGIAEVSPDAVDRMGVDEARLGPILARVRRTVARMVQDYRPGGPPPVGGRTAVVVDDGVATGRTAAVAARVARTWGPDRLVLAVPVAPPAVVERLRRVYDDVVCLSSPTAMQSIGSWYDEYRDTSEVEVRAILTWAASPTRS